MPIDLSNYSQNRIYIAIPSPEESVRLQAGLFQRGYIWSHRGTTPAETHISYLCVVVEGNRIRKDLRYNSSTDGVAHRINEDGCILLSVDEALEVL